MKRPEAAKTLGLTEQSLTAKIEEFVARLQAENKPVPADASAEDISVATLKQIKLFMNATSAPALAAGTPKVYSKDAILEKFSDRDWAEIEKIMSSLKIDISKGMWTEQEIERIASHMSIASEAVEQLGLEAVQGKGQLAKAKQTAIEIAQTRNAKINKNALAACLKLEMDYAQTFGVFRFKTFWATADSMVANLHTAEMKKRLGENVTAITELAETIRDPEKFNAFLAENGATDSVKSEQDLDALLTEESATAEGQIFDKEMAADFLSSGQNLEEWQEKQELPQGLTMSDYLNLSSALRERMMA